MKFSSSYRTLGFAVLLFSVAAVARLRAEPTEAILSRMDHAAPAFHGVSADLKMTTFTKILDEKTVETGTLRMQRPKPNDTRAVIDFSGGSDARILSFESKKVRIFYPKLNEYSDYELGKNGNVLNQFLLLGFGSSGRDLAASYDIVNEGTKKLGELLTTKLSLTPKAPEVKGRIDRVEIWIAEGSSLPTQQQFYQPSGNFTLAFYSNIQLNPPGQKIELALPKDAKKQKK